MQCTNLGWACPHTQAGPDSLSLPRISPGLTLLAQPLADLLQQTPPSQVAAAPGPSPGRAAGPGEESDPPALLPASLPQLPGLPPGCLEGHLLHSVSRLGWGQVPQIHLIPWGIVESKMWENLVVVQQKSEKWVWPWLVLCVINPESWSCPEQVCLLSHSIA